MYDIILDKHLAVNEPFIPRVARHESSCILTILFPLIINSAVKDFLERKKCFKQHLELILDPNTVDMVFSSFSNSARNWIRFSRQRDLFMTQPQRFVVLTLLPTATTLIINP